MDDLSKTQPHYIRCIKPNYSCLRGHFVAGYVHEQLAYGGVMEAIRIARSGFPSRKGFDDFVYRYDVLLDGKMREQCIDADTKHITELILRSMKLERWQMGETKVFMKEGVVPILENKRTAILYSAATKLQSQYRTYVVQKKVSEMKAALLKIQSYWRRELAIMRVRDLKMARAALAIQSWWRMIPERRSFVAYRQNQKAIIIQSWVRAYFARKQSEAAKFVLVRKQRKAAAIKIQSCYRQRIAKKMFKKLKEEADYLQNLEAENQYLKEQIENAKKEVVVQSTDPPVVVNFTIDGSASIEREQVLISRLEEEKRRADLEMDELKAAIERLRRENNDLLAKQSKDTEKIDSLTGQLMGIEQTQESFDAKIEEITKEKEKALESHKHEISSMANSVAESHTLYKALREENRKLKEDVCKYMEDLSNLEDKLKISEVRESDFQAQIKMLTPQKKDRNVTEEPVEEVIHPLAFERLTPDKQNDFLQLMSCALKNYQYLTKVSVSAYCISLALWEWARIWDAPEFQGALDTIPGHILRKFNESIAIQDRNHAYYLLNTVISLSLLSKRRPPLKNYQCGKTSEVQLAVFASQIGSENFVFFRGLRQMLYSILNPTRLVSDSASKGNGLSRKRLEAPATVRAYLLDFQGIMSDIENAHIDSSIVKVLILEMLNMTDMEILNQLLMRRECCSTSSARILDLTLRQIEKWCLTACSDVNISSQEIRCSLKRSIQACNFLLVHKTDIARAHKHGIPLGQLLQSKTDKLNLQQVYRLVAYHHDDWILGNRMNSDSITLLHGLKKEIARSSLRTQSNSSDPLASPNHAAVTWSRDDTEAELLISIESETAEFQEAITQAMQARGGGGTDPWYECLKDAGAKSKFPKEFEEISGFQDMCFIEAF